MATVSELVYWLSNSLTTAPDQNTSALFTANQVMYSLNPLATLDYPPNDIYAVIQPLSMRVKDYFWDSTTQYFINITQSWQLNLWIFCRLGYDEAQRDDQWLQNGAFGSDAVVDRIIYLLQGYAQADSDNQWGYELEEVTWRTEEKNSIGWAVVQMRYRTDLTQHTKLKFQFQYMSGNLMNFVNGSEFDLLRN